MTSLVSFPAQLRRLAEERPRASAVTCGERSVTRAELVHLAEQLARTLSDRGVAAGAMVTISLPNSVDWFVAMVASWQLGAIPSPVSARLPVRELEAIVELADPAVVVGATDGAAAGRPYVSAAPNRAGAPDDRSLPDAVSPAWKAPTSGGSTGRPKLIVSGDPALLDPAADPPLMLRRDGVLVMPGPLYHNGPLIWSCQALLAGNHVVVLPRFDAEATLAAIEDHRGDVVYLVPTMMKRIWRLPVEVRERYDLSSLRVVWHLAEPCPPWLKDAWISWLGAERIVELYGGTEGLLSTVITGPEWVAHRGSVGRPVGGQVRICDTEGNDLPPGAEGEVWLRSGRDRPSYRYIGATPRARAGGWESLGDMGWLDDEGYLYLGDRASDMILTGGSNVYPAEVEAALQEHPAVRSCAVIGLPDEDLGNVVHAIVEADAAALDVDELRSFLRERLVAYKQPRTIEVVDTPLRDEAGKARRSLLRAERTGPAGLAGDA